MSSGNEVLHIKHLNMRGSVAFSLPIDPQSHRSIFRRNRKRETNLHKREKKSWLHYPPKYHDPFSERKGFSKDIREMFVKARKYGRQNSANLSCCERCCFVRCGLVLPILPPSAITRRCCATSLQNKGAFNYRYNNTNYLLHARWLYQERCTYNDDNEQRRKKDLEERCSLVSSHVKEKFVSRHSLVEEGIIPTVEQISRYT